jgi:agmatinase
MTKQEKIENFDPNSYANKNSGMFGLPFSIDDAETVLIPVPWEVTVSYGGGTSKGPAAVLEASYQVDLYDPFLEDAWKNGIFLDEVNPLIKEKSKKLRKSAKQHINNLEAGLEPNNDVLEKIKTECLWLNSWTKERALELLRMNKSVAMLGGDHSTPLGLMQAMAEIHEGFGILQIDAHADLRDAFEGFEFSHASIMFNALKIEQVKKLVQVGIRDYCQSELEIIENSNGRVSTYFDRDLKSASYIGKTWKKQCEEIINDLPQKVYISFDIDGLDPKLCPNTGTPVAGGFETEQVLFLFEMLVESGREIISFDLNEIGVSDETDWDANVGARLLYRLCNLMTKSKLH